MYLRRVTRKNKNGSQVAYLQLAQNEWDPKAKYAKAKVIYSFGREDQVDRAVLERLVRSITRFLSPEEALRAQEGIGEALDEAAMVRIGAAAMRDTEAVDLAVAEVDDVEARIARGHREVDDADIVASRDAMLVERRLRLGEELRVDSARSARSERLLRGQSPRRVADTEVGRLWRRHRRKDLRTG